MKTIKTIMIIFFCISFFYCCNNEEILKTHKEQETFTSDNDKVLGEFEGITLTIKVFKEISDSNDNRVLGEYRGITLTVKEFKEMDIQRKKNNAIVRKKSEEVDRENAVKYKRERIDMENIIPPPPVYTPFPDIKLTKEEEIKSFKYRIYYHILSLKPQYKKQYKSLNNAWNSYSDDCVGGDVLANNCAHYLSNAFIIVGYTSLSSNNPYIHARCNGNFSSYTQKRPIRAKDMRDWFNSVSAKTVDATSEDALIQKMKKEGGGRCLGCLSSGGYYGGHVFLLDANSGQFKGRGYYPAWPNQKAYKIY